MRRAPADHASGGAISNALRSANSPQEFDIPVITTLMGIGAMDTTHALSMRVAECTARPRQLRGRRLRTHHHRRGSTTVSPAIRLFAGLSTSRTSTWMREINR